MSVQAIAAVWSYRGGRALTSGARLVLLRLADVAHSDGSNAFLAVATIAADCELDRTSVQRALRYLEEAGLIEVQEEATNRRPTVYRLCLPGLRRPAEPVYVGLQNTAPKIVPLRSRGGVGADHDPPDPDPEEGSDHSDRIMISEDHLDHGSGGLGAAPTPPPVREALWAAHRDLTGLLAPSVLDERQMAAWEDDGVTVAQVQAARDEIAGWDRKPERPWQAFRSALGRQLVRGLQPADPPEYRPNHGPHDPYILRE